MFIVLLNKEAPLSFGTVGDVAEVDALGRKVVGAEGLETRLRSFSVSLIGDGESSIISTHPEVSAAGVRLAFVSISALRLTGTGLFRSSPLARRDADRFVVTGVVATGEYGPPGVERIVDASKPFGRPFTLPIRNRGTRVWIFCSKILTRARISVTICTPLLFDVVPGTPLAVLEVDAAEGLRVTRVGRVVGVRGGIRDDDANEGSVVERAIEEGLGMADWLGWKPARCKSVDWPVADPSEPGLGRVGVLSEEGGLSEAGNRSESWRSAGGGVVRRFSLEMVDGAET